MSLVRELASAVAVLLLATCGLAAAPLPPIVAGPGNIVPACVTAARLTSFVEARNQTLDPRLRTVAESYQRHGRALGLRWDYAFFQMVIETNWLRFHQPNGRPGLVSPRQNNFAGLGATGRGQPGEAFADVSTGVLAHLQHVLMYAGATIDQPVATRTRLVQGWGEIPDWARRFHRPVTYADLTRKWSPHDRGYSDDIAAVAGQYFERHCTVRLADAEPASRLPFDPQPTGSIRGAPGGGSLFRRLLH